MRKVLCVLVLFCMTLHCASRLGILSYLYGKRHSIAFTLGLIQEIPIAMCSSDYNPHSAAFLDHLDNNEKDTPAVIAFAHEINLFVQNISFNLDPEFSSLGVQTFPKANEAKYPSPPLAIFHPPGA